MIRIGDVLFGVVAPVAFVLHLFLAFIGHAIAGPFGKVQWWFVACYWALPVWIILIFFGPVWAWLTRKNPAKTLWRSMVQSDSVPVRVATALALVCTVWLASSIGPDLARLTEELRTGPVVEEDVVCPHGVWVRETAGLTLVFADGSEVHMQIPAELRDLREGVGKRLTEHCKSNEPFTLTWWPTTQVIAEVND